MTKILILGGTKEAAELAENLVAEGNVVETSLAGRTREPGPIAGSVRIGGFGGVEGLASYLQENRFQKLIDATHPFAKQISANAVEASRLAQVTLEVRTRPPWRRTKGDRWTEVACLEEARETIPAGARVLLALGSQHIASFASRKDVFFVVRMVDQPEHPLPLAEHALLIGKPSTNRREEAAMLRKHRITHIVCRNSGGKGAYAKIEAARNLGMDVIIVAR